VGEQPVAEPIVEHHHVRIDGAQPEAQPQAPAPGCGRLGADR
jgi:hypothetical protein